MLRRGERKKKKFPNVNPSLTLTLTGSLPLTVDMLDMTWLQLCSWQFFTRPTVSLVIEELHKLTRVKCAPTTYLPNKASHITIQWVAFDSFTFNNCIYICTSIHMCINGRNKLWQLRACVLKYIATVTYTLDVCVCFPKKKFSLRIRNRSLETVSPFLLHFPCLFYRTDEKKNWEEESRHCI